MTQPQFSDLWRALANLALPTRDIIAALTAARSDSRLTAILTDPRHTARNRRLLMAGVRLQDLADPRFAELSDRQLQDMTRMSALHPNSD